MRARHHHGPDSGTGRGVRRRSALARRVTLVASVLVLGGTAAVSASGHGKSAAEPFRVTDFATDPGWDGHDNRPTPDHPCREATFDFGYRPASNYAGSTPGEIGGTFTSSTPYRAYYAMPLAGPLTLDSSLSASGTIDVLSRAHGSFSFGWFNRSGSTDWRVSDALVLHLTSVRVPFGQTPPPNSYAMFAAVGSRNYLSNGTKGSNAVLQFGQSYDWSLRYVPNGGDQGTGLISFTIGGQTGTVSVAPEVRKDGATFDRFGFLSTQAPRGGTVTAYVDDLVVNGQQVGFGSAADPRWEGYRNEHFASTDCYVAGRQNFGYVSDGGRSDLGSGAIGGIVWRPPAWYADRVGPLGLKDTLYATGKIELEHATVDTSIWLGWFNSKRTIATVVNRRGQPQDVTSFDLVAAHMGSPTHWGYRFTPDVRNQVDVDQTNRGQRAKSVFDSRLPALNPHGGVRRFWICYVPDFDGKGNARITTGLSADPTVGLPAAVTRVVVPAQVVRGGATLDRFGILSGSNAGKAMEVYVDDLRYTTGPGDRGVAGDCR